MLTRRKLWRLILALILALFISDIHRLSLVHAQQDDEETDPGGTNDEQEEEGEDEGTDDGEEEAGDNDADGEEQQEEGGDEDEEEEETNTEDDQQEEGAGEGEEEDEEQQKEAEEGEEEGKEEHKKGSKRKGKGEEEEEEDDEEQPTEEDSDDEGEEEQKERKQNATKLELLRCQDKNGKFLPIATVCHDRESKEFCERVFPSRDTNSHGRPRNCDLPGMKDVTYGCAHHCKVCCELKEHGCGDDPRYQINCAAQKEMCKNMSSMMTTACASTCGLCATGGCVDSQDGCIGLRHMCEQREFEEDMEKCARTCGFCTPKCADLSKDCLFADESSCNPPPSDHPEVNPYYEEMAKVCRQRCHLCGKAMPLNKRIAKKVADKANHLGDGLDNDWMEEEEERRGRRRKKRRI